MLISISNLPPTPIDPPVDLTQVSHQQLLNELMRRNLVLVNPTARTIEGQVGRQVRGIYLDTTNRSWSIRRVREAIGQAIDTVRPANPRIVISHNGVVLASGRYRNNGAAVTGRFNLTQVGLNAGQDAVLDCTVTFLPA